MEDRAAIISRILTQNPRATAAEIVTRTGIPQTTVRRYMKKLLPGTHTAAPPTKPKSSRVTPMQDLTVRNKNQKLSDLQKKYQQALDMINIKDQQLSALIAMGNTPSVEPIVTQSCEKREAVPVIVASDWHIEERVTAAITNGKNEYNLEIAEASVKQFFTNSCELINQAKLHSTVNTVVLALLGDLINGVLREEDLVTNMQAPVEAVATARNLIYNGIQTLVKATGCHIRVICCIGNHGRLTAKVQPSNQVHNSLEYLLYKMLERDFEADPDVSIVVPEAAYYIQDIYGVRIRFHHGHVFRFHGGIGGLSVPVLRKISQLNLIENADLDVCGHFHSMQIFNNCILNGSLVGANGYSMSCGIPFEPPRQVFFLIDSKYGRSVVAPIFIDREVAKDTIAAIS